MVKILILAGNSQKNITNDALFNLIIFTWILMAVRVDISALVQYKLPYTHRLYTYKQTWKCVCTCFIGGGVCRHAPCAGLAAFGHHDRELIHGVGLQSRDGVTECRRIRRLTTTHT